MSVAYVSSGTRSDADGTANLTPSYPASIAAGDLLVLRFAHANNTTQVTATYTPGDSFNSFNTAKQNSTRLFTYYKIASGTESGTMTITVSGGAAGNIHWAQIDRYTGADAAAPLYGSVVGSTSSATIADADVTTTANGDMAVNHSCLSAATATVEDFTGETGGPGDWSKQLEQEVQRPFSGLWTAVMAVAGAIGGGTFTSAASGVWITQGFGIKAAAAAVSQAKKFRHYLMLMGA